MHFGFRHSDIHLHNMPHQHTEHIPQRSSRRYRRAQRWRCLPDVAAIVHQKPESSPTELGGLGWHVPNIGLPIGQQRKRPCVIHDTGRYLAGMDDLGLLCDAR